MPPVQPRPTMTTSTSFILVAMSSSGSTHVRDAERIGGVFLVAKLLDGLILRGEENAGGRSVFESNLASLETQQKFLALALGDLGETLAVGLHTVRIGGRNAGAIQIGRGERKLIALARHAQLPRALHVEAFAFAPPAGKRAIDVDV